MQQNNDNSETPLTRLFIRTCQVYITVKGQTLEFTEQNGAYVMGFLESYLRLPRYQRVLLGLAGIVVGWYGPSWMNYLFLDLGIMQGGRRTNERKSDSTNQD